MTAQLIDAKQASERLGVKPATLYAYVSRGRIRRQRRTGLRGSWFDPAEIDALAGGERAQKAELTVATAITEIGADTLQYRGHDAAAVSRTFAYEEICHLLWSGELPRGRAREEPKSRVAQFLAPPRTLELVRRAASALAPEARLVDRLAVAVPVAASADPLRFDLSPESVADSGRTLIAAMVDGLPARPGRIPLLRLPERTPLRGTVAGRLWNALAPGPVPGGVEALNSILVLLADHELATSTLAARVAASTRASPYAVVGAALGAFEGPLHGTVSEEVIALLADAAVGGAAAAIGSRLRRGQVLPGFGHRIYEGPDPRGVVMLELLEELSAGGDRGLLHRAGVVRAVFDAAGTKSHAAPNCDFGLGAFVYVTGMARDAGEVIFAIARTAGWIAHAIEEYEAPPLRFRGRALYVGAHNAAAGLDPS